MAARTVAGWLLVLACAGCEAPRAEERGAADAERAAASEAPKSEVARAERVIATSPSGAFTVAWRPVGAAVPTNELFELEVELFEGRGTDKPLVGAQLRVSAWMPEHMHGMSRRPQAVESEPGRYLVRGMLLHMEGLWQLFFDVTAGGKSERVESAVTLQ
jgi:hypothetical protein